MKKSFVYLICVLLMAAMLCGCGVSSTDSGMVSSSPAQTLPTASATVMPTNEPDGVGRRRDRRPDQLSERERLNWERLGFGHRIGHAEQQRGRIIAQI